MWSTSPPLPPSPPLPQSLLSLCDAAKRKEEQRRGHLRVILADPERSWRDPGALGVASDEGHGAVWSTLGAVFGRFGSILAGLRTSYDQIMKTIKIIKTLKKGRLGLPRGRRQQAARPSK